MDFNNQIDSPTVDYYKFGNIYRNLSPTDYIFSDKICKGTIKKIRVDEEGDCLTFFIDLQPEGSKTIEKDYTAVKCKIKNESLRKFIAVYANRNWKGLGTGNVFSKILSGKLPIFSRISADNLETIKRIVNKYQKELESAQIIQHQMDMVDSRLDKRIYALYGIDEAEQEFVESEAENLTNTQEDIEEQTPELE